MMEAGKYYVGDLCYVFSNEDWQNVCKLIIRDNNCLEGEFNLPDGRRFAIFNTAWGDGEYQDRDGHKYSVDSGSIGCTLMDNITAHKYPDYNELGCFVDFEENFEVSEDQGLIKIGHVRIETNDTYDTYEDDGEDYDEEVFDDWENSK